MNYEKLKKFYNGKKVFITGCTGFKGSWLCSVLLELGADIYGYSLDVGKDCLFYLLNMEKKIKLEINDIRNKQGLMDSMLNYHPDIVFHLAAQPLVLESYENPVYTYDVNVMGTVNVCESIRFLRNKKISFVNITTDKVYKNIEKNYLYKEDDILNGYDPYSNSKSCSELVTSSYAKCFFNELNISCSTCRSGNVIGGGDYSKNRIIPDLVRSITNSKNIILRHPNSVRPYQHVLEPIMAYVELAMLQYDNIDISNNYNIGPSKQDCIKTIDLVKKAITMWGVDIGISCEINNQNYESQLLMLDNTKIAKKINWKQTWNIDRSINETINWYKAKENNENMDLFTKNQILTFIKEMK